MSNPKGLYQRYNITKADGSPVDKEAIYFVLRVDQYGDDPKWTKACREALANMGRMLSARGHLPELARDILKLVSKIEEEIIADGLKRHG